jgi:hypothetical protein
VYGCPNPESDIIGVSYDRAGFSPVIRVTKRAFGIALQADGTRACGFPIDRYLYGVNSGLGRSGKVLRRALKLPDNSSAVTEAVIAATRSIDPRLLIVAICDERLHFLQSLKTWTVFGAGWGRRVADVKSAALAMAADARVVAHGK